MPRFQRPHLEQFTLHDLRILQRLRRCLETIEPAHDLLDGRSVKAILDRVVGPPPAQAENRDGQPDDRVVRMCGFEDAG